MESKWRSFQSTNMEVIMPGPQPLVRPVFINVDQQEVPNKDDYMEINYNDVDSSSPHSFDDNVNGSSESTSQGNRADLKRPDLKGTFRCSICSKVFCHSSSLSRHRMQAHFKSYKCTLCRKDITSNETLRAHMYKQHQISRMFMCRCCNWAFPDKTSLHMHIQAREEGKSISVPVIGKGMTSEAYPDHPPPFSSLLNINNNINNNNNSIPPFPNGVIQQPQPMNFFPTVPPPPNPDDLGRLRDRLMMNQIMNQQALGNTFNWLNQLPKPIPTTRPIDLSTKTEEDLEINVEKDNENQKSHEEDKLIVTVSDNEDTKSKRTDSPCENGCSSSTEGSSPSHTDSAMSPVNIFRKSRGTPSAFHHLNVDSRGFSGATSPSHVSPSETHSSISPDGPTTHACYECAIYKTKLTMADNKCRYLENRANSLQTEAIRAQSQMASAESAFRVLENETRALREHTEQVQRKLLDCQEQALRFVQSERTCSQQAVIMFLNQLIQSTIIR